MNAVNYIKNDRIPLWSVYHYGAFNDKWRKYLGLDDTVNPREYYGYDTAGFTPDESFFISEKKVISEDSVYLVENDGFGRIVRRKKDGYFPHVVEQKLKKKGDIDSIVFEGADTPGRYLGLPEHIENDSGLCCFAKTGGIYIRSHSLWPEDRLLTDMILDPGFCNALFDKVADHLLAMSLETLKRTGYWETGLWVYDDMASTYSPMFSPALFEKYMLPRYKKIINECRKAGCRHFYFHSDGNILPVMDMLIEAGFEGFNPLEPRSGLGLLKLREKYGKKIILFGGICNTEILPSGDRASIKSHVEPLVELAKDGGVVLGTASVAGDVPPEAYDYFMKLIRELQGLPV
jgi:hypothetical protein